MGDRGSASTSIDIELLCKELLKEVPDRMQTTLRKEICVYQVPVNLRRFDEVPYTPKVICIGPIHPNNENELKGIYVNQFFNRLRGEKGEKLELFQTELVSTIKNCAVKIPNYYEEDSFKLCKDSKEFLKMIIWDAVFIFELFLKTGEFKKDNQNMSLDKYKYDYILGKPWLKDTIQRDLILLENQLPFCILDELYKIAAKYIKRDCSCFQCIRFHEPNCPCFRCHQYPKPVCSCFQCIRFDKPELNREYKPDCICFLELTCQYFDQKYYKNQFNPLKILHFTDLVRFFLSAEHPTTIFPNPIIECKSATRLEEAGMKFEPMPDECLINIKAWSRGSEREGIKKGELHVPPLQIDDHTECLLRNIMALEQCHFPKEAHVCNYVKFLDFLVDTKEDADLLIKSRVIVNKLGESAAVAKLINSLCQEIVEVSSCYSTLATELNDYSDSKYNKSKAILRRQYFKNVWIGTGTVVGLIVLFISLFDFVRSFL